MHGIGRFAPWEEGFDFTPPASGPGESTGPPNFVGIGVQKGGTSWWYELIAEHPSVTSRADIHKERHYLSRFASQPFGGSEVETYYGWFPRREGTITGEWTPDYLGYPWVPGLLARAAPAAKLLVIVRDPVERFRSGLSFRLSQGAFETEATVTDAIRQGFYARGLRRFLDYFPTDHILVLQYERCALEPVEELDATYRFLGLPAYQPDRLRRSINVSGLKVPIHPDALQRLTDLYAPDVRDLVALFPQIDTSLWPNFGAGSDG